MAMSMDMDTSMRETYRVESVDSHGVATVALTIDQLTGKLGSTSIPLPASLPAMTLKVAPDGAIESVNGGQVGAGIGALPFAAPGPLGGVWPSLPSGPVKPGDRWTKQLNEPMPMGMGTLQTTWEDQFQRYDTINGTRYAVISGHFTSPMDVTIDVSKLAGVAGWSGYSPSPGVTPPVGFSLPPGMPGFTGGLPVTHLKGTTTGAMTSWVQVDNGHLFKASGSSTSNVTEDISMPSPAPSGTFVMMGPTQMTDTQSLDVTSA
jgi:hypothetical protein